MNILILSNSHPYKDAGIIAKDLLNILNIDKKNNVKLIVREWDSYTDKRIEPVDGYFNFKRKIFLRKTNTLFKQLGVLNNKSLRTDQEYSIQDFDLTKTYYSSKKILRKAGFMPDIILVLFSQNFLSFKNYYEFNLLTKAPVFLFMMDMAPITGGCHYAWDCKEYVKNCGCCPALFSNDPFDQTYTNWKFKKEYIEKSDIKIIAGSEWTYKQLLNSSLFINKRKYKILLPINDLIFRPEDKSIIRKQLGLPLNKKIIFFGAASINNKRKGFDKLLEALKILKKELSDYQCKDIDLAIAAKEVFNEYLPFSYTLIGYLSHSNLPKAFQAADIFVSPSIEDSGPMMVNQSIMCGTPVVSFEMGVALDLVHNGSTGYRAKLNDSDDLATGIKYILELEDKEYKKMSAKCRETGVSLFHPKKIAKEFLDIFNNQL
jgi:glycosyltransferase involved in cell wall biosynthesis